MKKMITDKDLADIDRQLDGVSAPLIKKDNKVKSMHSTLQFRKNMGVGSVTRGINAKDGQMSIFTGIKGIDDILNQPRPSNYKRSNQLVQMFGCDRCWLRGTSKCMFDVKDGRLRMSDNGKRIIGYCDTNVDTHLILYRLSGSSTGLRHLRNFNMLNLYDLVQGMIAKYHKLKDSDRLTKTDMLLWDKLMKGFHGLGDRLDKSITQDEGSTVNVRSELTPSAVNRLIRAARRDEIEVDAEVVESND